MPRRRDLCSLALLFALLLVPQPARASGDPTGYWTTIDDDGKTPTSVIHIYAKGNQVAGRLVKLINPREKNPKCTACEGKRRNQPILGMEILWGLTRDGDEWSGGRILDPKNGKEYKCYIEVIDDGKRLEVRGYIGIALLGRTQYWRKAAPPKNR